MTDQEIDDAMTELVNGLDEERQIIVYRLLYANGLRIGASLDYKLRELRRTRKRELDKPQPVWP